MNKHKTEVYCRDCIYITGNDDCKCPNNLKPVKAWYRREYLYKYKPHELNCDNNCSFFRPDLIVECLLVGFVGSIFVLRLIIIFLGAR